MSFVSSLMVIQVVVFIGWFHSYSSSNCIVVTDWLIMTFERIFIIWVVSLVQIGDVEKLFHFIHSQSFLHSFFSVKMLVIPFFFWNFSFFAQLMVFITSIYVSTFNCFLYGIKGRYTFRLQSLYSVWSCSQLLSLTTRGVSLSWSSCYEWWKQECLILM